MNTLSRRRVAWPILISTVLLSCTPVGANEPTSGYPAIQRAFLREDFALVTSLAQTFILHNPDVPEVPRVWLWLALSLDRLQRTNEALTELDRLKARLKANDPLWPETFYWEGEICRRAFQMLRAKLAYQRLLELYPKSTWAPQAQVGLGLIYLHQQEYEAALGYFHSVALQQEGSPVALDARLFEGLCHLQLKHFKEAVAVFEPLLGRLQDPSIIAQATFYLGESLSGLGRYEEAVAAYQRAISVSPASQWGGLAQFALGWAYYQTSRCEESVSVLEQYVKRRGADHKTPALFAQGSCLMRMGRDADALSRFEQIMATDPHHPLALESGLALVDAYRRQERFGPAKELIHTLLRWPLDDSSRARVQLQLGAVALAQGNAAQAKTVFGLASDSSEPSTRQAALSGLGDVQMFLGDLAGAGRLYEDASRIVPDTSVAAYATYQIARIDLQSGAFDKAISAFQRLTASADPALADDAKLALALAYLNQHEVGLSHSLLDAVRRQRPTSLVAARAAYYLALLALEESDESKARQLCEETVAKAPQTGEAFEARLLLVELHTDPDSPDQAVRTLEDLYASTNLSRSQRVRLARRLGDLVRGNQLYAQAMQWYSRALELQPASSGELLYRIASCYEEAGDTELAIVWYGRIEEGTWRVRGQLAAGKLLEQASHMTEAAAIYQRLADEPIPEAKVAQERLAALQHGAGLNEEPRSRW